jgi:uncharacterized protein (TIGR03437 family)
MTKFTLIPLAMLMATPAWTQTPLAQAGYSITEPLEIAPGQVVLISTYGIPRRSGPVSVSIPETELDGLRGSIHQAGFTPMTVQFLGVRQSGCAANAPANCDPLTGLTLVMPLTLAPMGTRAELVINDRGTDVRKIPVRFVPDRIHVVSTCDEVAVSVGNDSPTNACGPVVRRAVGGQLITADRPARSGETIVVWAYGLGLPGRQVETEFGPVTPAMNAPSVHFFFGTQDAPAIPTRQGNTPAFAASFPPSPLYQINITIPTLPQGQGQGLRPCDGQAVTSNLAIMLTGYSSMDIVRLCVTP